MSKLLVAILLSTILLIPLIPPFESLGYEESKTLFFITVTSFSALIWVFFRTKQSFTKTDPWIKNLVLLFIVSLGITSLLGVNPKISFFGQAPYYQSWIFYALGGIFFFFVSLTKIKLKVWSLVLTLSSLIVAFLALKDWLLLQAGINVATYAGRVVSSFGQPNFYAGFLLLNLPFAYYLIKSEEKILKRAGWVGMVGEVMGIIVSFSFAAIGLLGALCLGFLISRFGWKLRLLLTVVSLLVIVGSFVSSWYFLTGVAWEELDKPPRYDWYYHEFPERGFFLWQSKWSENPEKRLYIWPVVGELIFKRPFLGYGLENMAGEVRSSSISWRHGISNLWIDRSHNYILDLLFFGGIVGLYFWIVLVWAMLKKAKGLILASLILYLIWIQFQNQSVVHIIYFWLLAGLIDRNDCV